MPFRFERLSIPDVVLIRPTVLQDTRGFFLETYKESQHAGFGLPTCYVQDNLSYSVRGVLRGLHYQRPPAAQAKLVTALRGEIFDVAVDIRRGSPWYAQWVGVELSAANRLQLFIPAGFAHGFCVLGADAEVQYKVTAEYDPGCEAGMRWDDPAVGVEWPVSDPIVSPKDAGLPALGPGESPFLYRAGDSEDYR